MRRYSTNNAMFKKCKIIIVPVRCSPIPPSFPLSPTSSLHSPPKITERKPWHPDLLSWSPHCKVRATLEGGKAIVLLCIWQHQVFPQLICVGYEVNLSFTSDLGSPAPPDWTIYWDAILGAQSYRNAICNFLSAMTIDQGATSIFCFV